MILINLNNRVGIIGAPNGCCRVVSNEWQGKYVGVDSRLSRSLFEMFVCHCITQYMYSSIKVPAVCLISSFDRTHKSETSWTHWITNITSIVPTYCSKWRELYTNPDQLLVLLLWAIVFLADIIWSGIVRVKQRERCIRHG